MTRGVRAALRRVQTGSTLSAFGVGFTIPFLYVYVAEVRGLGAGAAGLVLGAFAMAALVVLPVTGAVIDRRGPVPVLAGASLVAAVGAVCLGMSGSGTAALLSAAVLGAGMAVTQPALATLVVWCSASTSRTRAFAQQFFLQNLAVGAGGLLGGLLVDEQRPDSFTLLFVVEAAMFLALAVVTLTLRLPGGSPDTPGSARSAETQPPAQSKTAEGPGVPRTGGMRALLGHRVMVQLLVLGFVLFFACYGQFESGLSAYGVTTAGVSPSTLGVALAANTAVIVVAQFAVLRFVERCRRSRVIASVGLLWALAWATAGYAGFGHAGPAVSTAAFISTYALFGLGETLLAPILVPLVSELAPSGMAGRYNSAFALVKQLALAVGPAVGGPMAAVLAGPYVVTFVLVSLGVTVLALRLGRLLAPDQERPGSTRSEIVAAGGPAPERIAGQPAEA